MEALQLRDFGSLLLASACGLVVGALITVASPLVVLVVILGPALLAATLKHPEIALLGILVLTSSIIFESELPLLPIGVGSLHISDLVLVFLLALIVVRWLAEPDFKLQSTPLAVPLLLFVALSVFATIYAIVNTSLTFTQGFRYTRAICYYLTFFVISNLLLDYRQLVFLVWGTFLLGGIVAGFMIAQFALGSSMQILPGRVETLITQDVTYSDITRILPPGQSIIIVAFITLTLVIVLAPLQHTKALTVVLWTILMLGVVLTFLRNFWVMVFIAFGATVLIAFPRDRTRLVTVTLVCLMIGALLLLALSYAPESRMTRLVFASADRAFSFMGTHVVEDKSLRLRDVEYEYAIPQILNHPLLGLGLGAQYRPFDSRLDSSPSDDYLRSYCHNGHLWIMLQTGLPAYLSLVWVSCLFLWRSFRYWRHVPDAFLRNVTLAFALIYLGTLLSNITSPMFMQWFWIPVFGLMWGVNEVIIRNYELDRREPAPVHVPQRLEDEL